MELSPEGLLRAYQLTRAWLRDGVVRVATLPNDPDWDDVAYRADLVAREELVSLSVMAKLLDGIEEPAVVAMLMVLRSVLVALGSEIDRRLSENKAERAYVGLAQGEETADKDLIAALKLRTTTWSGRPVDFEERNATAFEHVVVLYRAAQERSLADLTGQVDDPTRAVDSPFRRYRPEAPPGWESVAGLFFSEEARWLVEDYLPALRGVLSQAGPEIRKLQDTQAKRESRRRIVLRRDPKSAATTSGSPAMPSPLEEAERRDTAKQGSAGLAILEVRYGSRVLRAVQTQLESRDVTDEKAADLAGLALRTYQYRKAGILRQLKDLAGQ
jgi:hypothetical protein